MFTLLLSRWELFCWMKVEIIGKLPTRRIIEINRKEVSLLPTTKKKDQHKRTNEAQGVHATICCSSPSPPGYRLMLLSVHESKSTQSRTSLAFLSLLSLRKSKMHVCMLSCFSHVWLFATLWTVAHQDPLSMAFSRQEYWSELSCPPQRDISNSKIKPVSPEAPVLQVDSLPLSHRGSPDQKCWEIIDIRH